MWQQSLMGGGSPLLIDPQELIQKALDATTATGAALIPQEVDDYVTELALQMSPFRQIIPHTPWRSGTYDKNRRTALPRARFIGDGTSAPETNSTISRFQEPLKILQSKGGVSGFLQSASQDLTNAEQLEIAGHTLAMINEEAWGILYGNRFADPYQFDGLDYWNLNGGSNIIPLDGASMALTYMDQAIAKMKQRGVNPDPSNSAWIMSPTALNWISALQQGGQRWNDKIEVAGGFVFDSYRKIPIIETSLIQGGIVWPGGSLTATGSTGASTGTMADGVYKYVVTAVTMYGETLASAEASGTVASGSGSGKVTLAWTAPTGADAGTVRKYRIYRTPVNGSSGTKVLYTEIPGSLYQADSMSNLAAADYGTFVDTGSRAGTVLVYDYLARSVTGAMYTPGYSNVLYNEPLVNEEDIRLICTSLVGMDGNLLHMPTMKDMGYFPLQPIMDKKWFLMLAYECLIAIEQYQVVIARAKLHS